jgi:SnoaL-like domain
MHSGENDRWRWGREGGDSGRNRYGSATIAKGPGHPFYKKVNELLEEHSREALAPVFADLNKYDTTTHFVGQSSIFTLTSDRATGEAYRLAHHVTVDGGKRRLMLASLRYLDTFVKLNGAWLFSERLLYVDWTDERALS